MQYLKKIKSWLWLEIFNSVLAYFSLALQTSTELSWMKCYYDKSDADDWGIFTQLGVITNVLEGSRKEREKPHDYTTSEWPDW